MYVSICRYNTLQSLQNGPASRRYKYPTKEKRKIGVMRFG